MTKRVLAIAAFAALLGPTSAIADGDDGFVPVDPAALDTVDGQSLMITAYAVIVGLVLAYSFSLFLRQRSVQKKAKKLQSRLQPRTNAKPDATA